MSALTRRLANLEIAMAGASTFTASTPSISDAVNISSLLAPSTVARSQLARCYRLLLRTAQ
jgi:hypothetical protein